MTFLRTSDLARAAGVHPNTVRRYAERGWLPPVRQGANGYRQFTQEHLDCLRVARMIVPAPFPGTVIRLAGRQIIQRAAARDWEGALAQANAHRELIQAERAQAEAAAAQLERWAREPAPETPAPPLRIGQVARALGVSIDMLRNWERNGLLAIPRNPHNRYRAYGAADLGRLRVIQMLSRAGYSQMAILRMVRQLDRGVTTNLRQALDTLTPDEDAFTAADRWLSTLAEHEARARRVVATIEQIRAARAAPLPPASTSPNQV